MKILIAIRGFEEPEKNGIMESLNANGAEVDSIVLAHTKMGVLQTLTEQADIGAVIVSEYLESGSPYTPGDIDKIDEIREELRVIPIMINEHYGKTYVERLHAMAIYNALFEKDASMNGVAELIKNGRNKKVARLYYGIQAEIGLDVAGIIDPGDITTSLTHVVNGGPRKQVMERLLFVESRLSSSQFVQLLSKLPQEYLDEAKNSGKFNDFFESEEDVPVKESRKKECDEEKKRTAEHGIKIPTIAFQKGKNVKIPIPIPSFTSGSKTITTVVEDKTMIGVVGVGSISGSTFVALNLARYISFDKVHIPVIIQPPSTKGRLCNVLKKKEEFVEHYRNFFELAEPQEAIDDITNMIDGVRFVVDMEEADKSEKWTYVKTVKMLNVVGNPCILDFGCGYDQYFYMNTLKDCQVLIVVLDGSKEPDIGKIREIKEMYEKTGIGRLVFAVNRYKSDLQERFECVVGKMYDMVFIPASEKEKNVHLAFEYASNLVSSPCFGELSSICGFEGNEERKIKKERTIIKHKMVTNGTMEIGVCAVQRGSGATHTAILCAQSLASDYRVAYVEQNAYGHMAAMISELSGERRQSSNGKFSYNGVDYYYGIDYMQFVTAYRNDYDYVLADFGVIDSTLRDAKRTEFLRMGKRFVVADGSLWRRQELLDYYEDIVADTEEIVYFIPYGERDTEKEIRKLCYGIEVYTVGFNVSAFEPGAEQMRLFQSVVGMVEADRKRGVRFMKRFLKRG